MLIQFDECGLNARKCAIFISFVYIVASLIFIFSIIQTLDYPDYLPRSRRVRIIEVRLYRSSSYWGSTVVSDG